MKKMKLAISTAVLLATLGVVGFSNFQVVSAYEEIIDDGGASGPRCDCRYTNGDLGVRSGGGCEVVNCWLPLD
jgi:hypothetical protein